MADLKVDYDALELSLETAKSLKTSFDDLPDRVGSHGSDWGDGRIGDAMHEFATNWDYRRDLLSGAISEFGEKVEGCLEAFKEADQKLYEGLTKNGNAPSSPSGPR